MKTLIVVEIPRIPGLRPELFERSASFTDRKIDVSLFSLEARIKDLLMDSKELPNQTHSAQGDKNIWIRNPSTRSNYFTHSVEPIHSSGTSQGTCHLFHYYKHSVHRSQII